jgi:hypothetical protein
MPNFNPEQINSVSEDEIDENGETKESSEREFTVEYGKTLGNLWSNLSEKARKSIANEASGDISINPDSKD